MKPTQLTTDKVMKAIEAKIRFSYEGILPKAQIDETVKWWIKITKEALSIPKQELPTKGEIN